MPSARTPIENSNTEIQAIRGISVSALTVAIRKNWPLATPATFTYRDIMETSETLE